MSEERAESCHESPAGVLNRPVFHATHWSVVLSAAERESPEARSAREELCRDYWYPLYAYVRQRGYSPEDAQDLTQEFFARLLAKHGLQGVSPLKGKFRSFLLASINHLLSDERDRAHSQKRGGGQPILALEAQTAEERYRLEPVDELTPEKVFERRWAAALVERVLGRLEEEYSGTGRGLVYRVLQPFIAGEGPGRDYTVAARQLGMTEGAARVAAHRLRQRFGARFRAAVAETVDTPEDLEAEMRYLLAALSG